jgi:hypothetical protein
MSWPCECNKSVFFFFCFTFIILSSRNPSHKHATLALLSALLLLHLSQVEGELITFQNVAIATAALAGPRRDTSVEATRSELLLERSLKFAKLFPFGLLALHPLTDNNLALRLLAVGSLGVLLSFGLLLSSILFGGFLLARVFLGILRRLLLGIFLRL